MTNRVDDARRLLRHRELRILLAARLVSNFGNGMSPVAIAFGVLSLPSATPKSLSQVMFAQMLPIVAFMLVGGVIADRVPRAWLIGSTDVLLSVFVIANGSLLIAGRSSVTTFAVVAFVGGTLTAVWWPAMMALTTDLVPEEDLQAANSLVGLSNNTTNFIGVMLGGALVATIGAGQAIVVDGLTFLVAGVLVLQLRHTGSRNASSDTSSGMVDDLVHGWRQFASLKWVVAVVAGYSVMAMLFEALLSVLGPVRAKESLGGPGPWSWILAAWSLGLILGVLLILRLHPKRPLVTGLLMQLGMASWFFAAANTTHWYLIAIAGFLCGIGMDAFNVLWQTALQQNVPRDALSRVGSYDAFGSLLFAPLGLLFAGPLAMHFGTTSVLNACGVIFIVVLAIVLSVPEVRNLPRLAD